MNKQEIMKIKTPKEMLKKLTNTETIKQNKQNNTKEEIENTLINKQKTMIKTPKEKRKNRRISQQ